MVPDISMNDTFPFWLKSDTPTALQPNLGGSIDVKIAFTKLSCPAHSET